MSWILQLRRQMTFVAMKLLGSQLMNSTKCIALVHGLFSHARSVIYRFDMSQHPTK